MSHHIVNYQLVVMSKIIQYKLQTYFRTFRCENIAKPTYYYSHTTLQILYQNIFILIYMYILKCLSSTVHVNFIHLHTKICITYFLKTLPESNGCMKF